MQYGPLKPPGIDAQQTSAATNKLLISFRGDSFHLQQGIESQRTATAPQKTAFARLEIYIHLSIYFLYIFSTAEHAFHSITMTI